MPSNPTYFYITVDDYRTQSQAQSYVPAEDDDVTTLILEAMVSIDAYIGKGWTPYADSQEFIFPREQDEDSNETPFIPRPISLAARKVADAILLKRQKSGEQGVLAHEVASESNLGHSFQRKENKIDVPMGFEWWPRDVFGIIEPFIRHGGYLAIDETEELSTRF